MENLNLLERSIVAPFISDEDKETVSIYPGAFKPPHRGHLAVLEKANAVADKTIVLISSAPREDVEAEESLKIWELYTKDMPNVEVKISERFSPVAEAYSLFKHNPEKNFNMVIGKGEVNRLDNLKKYTNAKPFDAGTFEDLSATRLRKAIREGDTETIQRFIPKNISVKEYLGAFDQAPVNEGTFNTNNHVATFDGPDGYAEVYKQTDGSFYIVVGGEYDYDMTAANAQEVSAKLKRDGLTRLVAGEINEGVDEDAEIIYIPVPPKQQEFGYEEGEIYYIISYNKNEPALDPMITLMYDEYEKMTKIYPDEAKFQKTLAKIRAKAINKPIGENINEDQNTPYYDFQIILNPGESMGTIFVHKDGRIAKHTVSRDDNPLVLNYRNVTGLIKAAYRVKNDNTEITIWDETGKGKTYPFNLESIKLIRKKSLNEDQYPEHFLQDSITSFAQYMEDTGMQIAPAPRVEFVEDDEENAEDILGKTAYYDPQEQVVVLYTLGRHPKDILRSFAHEMIHHMQNLEGRLGNIQTTNTNEDSHLDEIEREAYEHGNITFRNWTDSILNESNLNLQKKKINEEKLDLNLPEDINQLYKAFIKNGKKLYVVGGAVRDALLGKDPKDYDLATNATPDEVLAIAEKEGLKTLEIGKQFGVVMVNGHEIATFRKDIGKGRRPDSVEYTDIEGDVNRRDLTINALFYDIDKGEVVDLVGGVKDLRDKKIRTVGKASERFEEDALRKLRALRFHGQTGGNLGKETLQALKDNPSLEGVSGERIRDEFLKGLKKAISTKNYLETADELGFLNQILPGLTITTPYIDEEDYVVLLAYLLNKNQPSTIAKQLNQLKYSGEEAKQISFLSSLNIFSPNQIQPYKKFQKISGVTDEQINKIGELIGKDFSKFLDFNLSVRGNEAPTNLKGPDIGDWVNKKEIEKYNLLNETK